MILATNFDPLKRFRNRPYKPIHPIIGKSIYHHDWSFPIGVIGRNGSPGPVRVRQAYAFEVFMHNIKLFKFIKPISDLIR